MQAELTQKEKEILARIEQDKRAAENLQEDPGIAGICLSCE